MNEDLFLAMSVMDDDTLSDGAWWAMLENAVTFYNEEHNTTFDEFNGVHAYLNWKSKQERKKAYQEGAN